MEIKNHADIFLDNCYNIHHNTIQMGAQKWYIWKHSDSPDQDTEHLIVAQIKNFNGLCIEVPNVYYLAGLGNEKIRMNECNSNPNQQFYLKQLSTAFEFEPPTPHTR